MTLYSYGASVIPQSQKKLADLAMDMTNLEVHAVPIKRYDEIISSGKLTIFSNDNLKFALSSYNGRAS
jgi:hypothetical protein